MFHQFSSLAAFGLTIVFVLGVVTSSGSPECKTVTAAFYSYPYMNLIIDDKVFQMGDSVEDKFPVKDFRYDHPITAAFDMAEDEFYLVSAHHQEGFRDKNGIPSHRQIFGFSKVDETFKEEPGYKGVDAAVTIDNHLLYYFFGCHHVSVNPFIPYSQQVDKRPNRDLNLPCDVDAATYAPTIGEVIVIKGNGAWIYNNREGKFKREIPLSWLVPGVSELTFAHMKDKSKSITYI